MLEIAPGKPPQNSLAQGIQVLAILVVAILLSGLPLIYFVRYVLQLDERPCQDSSSAAQLRPEH